MNILQKALNMLEKYPLCDHCLGRQFALLGHGLENAKRGEAIKLVLTFNGHEATLLDRREGEQILNVLATNGFSKTAVSVLEGLGRPAPGKASSVECYLCADKFKVTKNLVEKSVALLGDYEYNTLLVGTELPVDVAEREDEFRAEFGVLHAENMRNEFGRVIGKELAERVGKAVDFKKPEMVVLVNPFRESVSLQPNPLFVSGRYRKLVRDIPQSKWFCSTCHGKGCEKCNGTGKMYAESVQEIVEVPFLEATKGIKASFHASGREDIDARMLGSGRPFVIEITEPKKRFLDLAKLMKQVNFLGKGKVQISDLRVADKEVVRSLKKGEATQKEYRLTMEFEHKITPKDLRLLETRLTNVLVIQQTPLRVVHRRANLAREKYIYEVNVKKMSPQKAEMKIRCQGGLYVKELVTGDEGRTIPNVSEILNNKAKPLKLDVLNILMDDKEYEKK
jgi:tRNA pseudouridine synthase 10